MCLCEIIVGVVLATQMDPITGGLSQAATIGLIVVVGHTYLRTTIPPHSHSTSLLLNTHPVDSSPGALHALQQPQLYVAQTTSTCCPRGCPASKCMGCGHPRLMTCCALLVAATCRCVCSLPAMPGAGAPCPGWCAQRCSPCTAAQQEQRWQHRWALASSVAFCANTSPCTPSAPLQRSRRSLPFPIIHFCLDCFCCHLHSR